MPGRNIALFRIGLHEDMILSEIYIHVFSLSCFAKYLILDLVARYTLSHRRSPAPTCWFPITSRAGHPVLYIASGTTSEIIHSDSDQDER